MVFDYVQGGKKWKGGKSQAMSGFMACVLKREKYVLQVINFEANICLPSFGISARDARVAVEVVYHHSFLVFGQRSVQGMMMRFHSV